MNRTTFALIATGLLGLGMQALADDTSADQSTQKAQHHKFMKDCMDKAKAANNGMSEQDSRKACMDQWKASGGNPDKPITPAH